MGAVRGCGGGPRRAGGGSALIVGLVLVLVAALGPGASPVAAAADGTGSISGTVTVPAGRAAGELTATLYEVVPAQQVPGRVGLQERDRTSPGTDGRFTFSGVSRAQLGYVVLLTDPRGLLYPRTWVEASNLNLLGYSPVIEATAGGEHDVGTVQMVQGATVTGRLTGPDGRPAAGVRVPVVGVDCGFRCREASLGHASTGSDGGFRITGIPAAPAGASYLLEFFDPAGRFRDQRWGELFGSGLRPTADETLDAGTLRLVPTSGTPTPKPTPTKPTPTVKPRPPTPSTMQPPVKRLASPVVKGRAKVGRTLKVTKGSWRPSRVRVSLQWQVKRGSKAVKAKGATRAKLRLAPRFKGKRVRVRVTVSAKGHRSVVHTTKWSRKVA